jgi:D-galacturonate reductase
MKYTPTDGKFSGQQGYGYRSFEAFIDAVNEIRSGAAVPSDFHGKLATLDKCFRTTAILEAGRLSLDSNRTVKILYENELDSILPTSLVIA